MIKPPQTKGLKCGKVIHGCKVVRNFCPLLFAKRYAVRVRQASATVHALNICKGNKHYFKFTKFEFATETEGAKSIVRGTKKSP